MNHKRKRPKNARAGCLFCKPHKANGSKCKHALAERRAQVTEDESRSGVEDGIVQPLWWWRRDVRSDVTDGGIEVYTRQFLGVVQTVETADDDE